MKRQLLIISMLLSSFLLLNAQSISGELKKWHKITIDFKGPAVSEDDANNPFLNYRLNVTFTHTATGKQFVVPGFFAADGDAANSSAAAGDVWRVHFAPGETGEWTYQVDFRKGGFIAIIERDNAGESGAYMDGLAGSFVVLPTDKSGDDFRARGRLQYVGRHYLRLAETGEYFLKNGVDAPENLLAYTDFDGNFKTDGHKDHLVKSWEPHLADWKPGDPAWQDGKGKGLIGAVNYLASEGLNAMSFLTMNIIGDDQNVFPYVDYETYDRMDVSKLAQWEVVFEHAQQKGIFLHFKTQEAENQGLLDNGGVGAHRKLYYRELIARFGHHLALNWNLGEENGDRMKNLPTPPQATAERRAMAQYLYDHDPYHHHIVIHNGSPFDDMLGPEVAITGPSIQTNRSDFANVHGAVLKWRKRSAEAGKAWACAVDEPGDAQHALVPDKDDPRHDDARKNALWGTYMAGGWGIEWYFGYKHDHSDLTCEDFRSRDLFWDQCRASLKIMTENEIPYWQMVPIDSLVDKGYCLGNPGNIYMFYLPDGAGATITLPAGEYALEWYDPLTGEGPIRDGDKTAGANGKAFIADPPHTPDQDWIVVARKSGMDDLSGKGTSVYTEQDGIVEIEAESATTQGQWIFHANSEERAFISGYSGPGCIQFIGNTEVSGPADSPLVYKIKISNPGSYSIGIRALEAPLETGEGDKANDCYVYIAGQRGWEGKTVKHVLLGDSFQWSWNVKAEPAHHDFHYPEYELSPGICELVIAGRSKNFFIDKIVLFETTRYTREAVLAKQ